MATDKNVELLVREGDVAEFRFVDSTAPTQAELGANEILVRIEKFGFSANNVTYAVLGRSFRYFDFFPSGEEGWGKVPVWGMGRVEQSRHPELPAGTRMYGYFPLARSVRLLPSLMTPTGFDVDRGSLPAVYNRYAVVGTDPFYLSAKEDQMMVLRPLFFTSLLLDDYLAEHDSFGADAVLISSASSKTSFGLAFMLARRRTLGKDRRRYTVVGLTSGRHVPFVEELALYDEVVTYDGLAKLEGDRRSVLVDVAGNPETLANVERHFGDRRMATILVGLSHWDKSQGGSVGASASPRTEFFFAPTWVDKRLQDWGGPRLVETLSSGWQEFMDGIDRRCRLVYGGGQDAVATAYRAMLKGEQRPDEGRVLSLWDDAFEGRR